MNLTQLQREREPWIARNFPNDRIEDSIFGAMEEIGEICHHYLKMTQGIRGERDYHRAEIRDGVADAVIFLAGIASWLEFDYGVAVTETWDKVKQRDWQRYPENGEYK